MKVSPFKAHWGNVTVGDPPGTEIAQIQSWSYDEDSQTEDAGTIRDESEIPEVFGTKGTGSFECRYDSANTVQFRVGAKVTVNWYSDWNAGIPQGSRMTGLVAITKMGIKVVKRSFVEQTFSYEGVLTEVPA